MSLTKVPVLRIKDGETLERTPLACYDRFVDPLTHTLVGVTAANAFFRKKIGPPAVPILALASNLPDIDALVVLSGNPTAVLLRRTFGHSIVLIPFWSFLLAWILRKYYPHLGMRSLWGLVLLGAIGHLFFDLVNSFGVVLLWPVSDWRPELALLFILDPFLTGLLLAPLLLTTVTVLRPYRRPLSQASMALVFVYLFLCVVSRTAAESAFAASAAKPSQADFHYLFPEPLGPHRWRGVVRKGNRYDLYLLSSATGQVEHRRQVETARGDPRVEAARKSALARRLEWFFKAPVWTVGASPRSADLRHSPGVQENPSEKVSVYDLRFTSLVVDRETPFVFRLQTGETGRK